MLSTSSRPFLEIDIVDRDQIVVAVGLECEVLIELHLRVWVPIIRSWALTRGYALHPGTLCVASFTGSSRCWHGLRCAAGRSKDFINEYRRAA